MASKCQKFQPNIFNKLKCQSCFGAKELHSAQALESNKATRKVSKRGYLFVSPDFDFSNPLDRGRRWQRRFFRLYDDGELTFCVDEDPDTIPQGTLDMNKCTEVKDAEKTTTHPNSLAIITPNKTTYVKANSKEEIMWWQEVLSVFPKANQKPKNRRFTMPIFSNKENVQPLGTERKLPSVSSLGDGDATVTGRFEVEKVKAKEQPFSTYRGVRSMKHKTDKHYQEGLRKSSSLHDLSSGDQDKDLSIGMGLASSKFLSRSGDRLDYVSGTSPGMDHVARVLADSNYNNPYFTFPRRSWQALNTTSSSNPQASSSASSSASSTPSSSSAQHTPQVNPSHIPVIRRRGSADDKTSQPSSTTLASASGAGTKPKTASERARLHRERSSSMKEFPSQFTLPKPEHGNTRISMSGLDRLSSTSSVPTGTSSGRQSGGATGTGQRNVYDLRNNETDEFKMAKSSELQAANRTRSQPSIATSSSQPNATSAAAAKYEDLMYMKKGWLIKQGSSEKDWKKHWFVLTGNSLRYYKDAKAEESSNLDGRIDLSTCFDISEVNIGRNYGFRIKSRNGEYILSAMTSGIRNNWLKAIRLVMDLQTSSKGTTSTESDASNSPRVVDDLDLTTSADSSRLSASTDSRSSSESPKEVRKREHTKNIRRHYSDVSPGNVSKMFSVPGGLGRISLPPTVVGVVGSSSGQDKKPGNNDQVDSGTVSDQSESSTKKSDKTSNQGEQDSYLTSSGSSVPLKRFVEGSDNVTEEVTSQQQLNLESGNYPKRSVVSESKKEEEEKSRRAKSPSARIKEKSRAKVSRISSPPPGTDEFAYADDDQASQGQYGTEKDTPNEQEQNLSPTSYHDGHFQAGADDNLTSTEGSSPGGDGMLVELLETEVDSLKEQLETTHQELVKMHETNIDLKTKLQTVAREKDVSQSQPQHGLESPIMRSLWNQQQSQASSQSSSANIDSSQVTTMRRQVKESRDTIQKQKTEIEQLRSKLDMSMSKLTGTERALSEALKDLKQEKDKFMKLSNDWNKKIRNLEGQLKDANHKMERQKDSLTIKENECKRMETEVKANHQKIREHEREIIKLKAVEREYKDMKERIDGMDKQITTLRLEVKEKDTKCKNVESRYENHITELEQEFSRERDDMEQHLEDMKKKFLDAQHQSMANDMADLMQEKDEIISQLEEKLIENDKKMLETSEELQAEIDVNVDLQNGLDVLQQEKAQVDGKIKELEKSRLQLVSEKRKLEEENRSLVHHLEEYEKEALEISAQLDIEKEASFKLNKENEMLHEEVKNLHSDIELLEENFQFKEKQWRQDSSGEQDSNMKEMIENFVLVESELMEVNSTVSQLQTDFKDYMSGHGTGHEAKLVDMAELLENIGKRCENLQDILREGNSELLESKNNSENGSHSSEEFIRLQEKYDRAITEANNLRKEVNESRNHCDEIKNKNKELQDCMKVLDGNYKQKIHQVESKVDNLTLMVREVRSMPKTPTTSSPQKSKKQSSDLEGSAALSEKIEEQLNELEDRIEFVDKILRTGDEGVPGISDVEDDDEDEEESDSFMSSEEEEEEESEEEDRNSSGNSHLIGKLKQMKTQLEVTNNKIHDLTSEITMNQSSMSAVNDCSSDMDEDLKNTLRKYEEKIDSLASRLSEKVKAAKSGGAVLEGSSSDNTMAFQYCLKEMRAKLVDVNNIIAEHESLDEKSLRIVHKKLMNLLEFLNCLQRFRHTDYRLLGKVARQDSRAQSMLAERESRVRRSRLQSEEKLHIYADRLSVEAIILCQMAFLVQRYQMGDLYRDVLMKEICDANTVILELQRKIDEARKLYSSTEQEGCNDLVSTYAAILAEKIVLEGQLASCAIAADNHTTDDKAVLTSLQIADNPSILAMEVFLRSQLDSSIHRQLSKTSEFMDSSTGHIITRALVQGEITHALEQVKSKFSLPTDIRDVTDLLRRERKFSQEQLLTKHDVVCNSVEVYEAFVLSCLRYHLHHSQSQSSSLLEPLCKKMSEAFNTQIQKLQESKQQCEAKDQNKCQHIINVLQSELGKALASLKDISEPGSTTPEDEDHVDLDVMSAESAVAQLADILIHCAVVRGTVLYINEMVNLGNFPEIPDTTVFSSNISAGQNEVTSQLGQTLISEATSKQALAAELKKFTPEGASSEEASRVVDILGIIPDTGIFNPESLGSYGENLMREALYQAQLTYMSYKMKLQHEREMRDMKFKLESGQKVDLPSDSSKDAEGDIHASLSVFEEIFETKFQDDCEVLSILDKEIKQLQTASTELMSASNFQVFNQHLMSLVSTFEHELSVAQERHDIHVDVLRQEVSNICMRLEKMTDEYEKEKDVIVSDYEAKISTLQEELDTMKVDHEEELEQVRQDIMTAVSAIRANEEHAEADQYKDINRQILAQRDRFNEAITELQRKLSQANINLSMSQELEEHMGQLQASFPILNESSVQMPLSPPPILSPPPVPPVVRTETEETSAPGTDTLSFPDENGTTLDRSQHDYELELLKREKEEALAEEVKVTKAALDAMRKAYDEELMEEKEKYREALKTMYTDDFLSEIRVRHETEVGKLRDELKTVQMHYESKNEDYKLLEDKLQNTKTEFETHIKHLNTSNERLNELVNEEIEKLKDFVKNKSMGRIPGNATIEEELYDAQIMVRMKDAELQKLRSQVKTLENNLERTTEEQRNSMTQYLQMYKKYQDLETKYKQETMPQKDHDDGQRGTNRSIRRTPSFHHRTRSPSPQTQGPVKKEEHHSRDSLRRRHIDAKDLKRSKSSPSLPFVFGNRLPSTSGLGKSTSKGMKPVKATKS